MALFFGANLAKIDPRLNVAADDVETEMVPTSGLQGDIFESAVSAGVAQK